MTGSTIPDAPAATAPTVSGRVVGQQDENGAYIGSAMVTVTATDNDGGSGVASVEY